MIPYDTFLRYLESGVIPKLNFFYESKEYVIERREEEGEEPFFIFAREDGEPETFNTAEELSRSVTISSQSLGEIWRLIKPLGNDTLTDETYVTVLYEDLFGKIVNSASGTAEVHERYLTRYFFPTLLLGVLCIFAFLLCTLFVDRLSWTFFAIAASSVVAAFAVFQVILFSSTRKFRRSNPRAQLFLLNSGAVILTARNDYSIPYDKITRLDTEAGLTIVTLNEVYLFTPNHGEEITEALKTIYEEEKSLKKRTYAKKN